MSSLQAQLVPEEADRRGDEADQSQVTERLFLAEAMDAVEPAGNPGFVSLTYCMDCGDPIPEKRRQAIEGCRRCHDCQVEYHKERGR